MKKINENLHYFENLNDFINNVKNANRIKGRDNSSETGDYSFTSTFSLNEAWDLIEKKDTSFFKVDYKIKKTIENGKSVAKKRYYNDVLGYNVNVANYCLGVPCNMLNIKNEYKKSKIVDVVINNGVPCGINKNEIFETFSKILNDIIYLEKKGYRTNIYLLIGSVCDSDNVFKTHNLGVIKLKKDCEILDTKKLVFPVVHPSFLRRLSFRFRECFGTYDVTKNSYGHGLLIGRDRKRWYDKKELDLYNSIIKECKISNEHLYTSICGYNDGWIEKY